MPHKERRVAVPLLEYVLQPSKTGPPRIVRIAKDARGLRAHVWQAYGWVESEPALKRYLEADDVADIGDVALLAELLRMIAPPAPPPAPPPRPRLRTEPLFWVALGHAALLGLAIVSLVTR